MNRIAKYIFIILALFQNPAILTAYDVILPEDEAPETIFELQIGSEDIDLYAIGSWELSFTGSIGFGFSSVTKDVYTTSFPDMAPWPPMFKQIPDITISLWMMERYFFETIVTDIDNFNDNIFLLGYNGRENEFLRSVRIGNTDISINHYGFLEIPEESKSSMGAAALFGTEKTSHEILLRFDPAEKQKKIFIGNNEIIESRINTGDFISGRFFILPDNDVETLTVYIEDYSGTITGSDSRNYRLASADDAVLSEKEGFVFFREELKGTALVYYTKNGHETGDPVLGSDTLCGISSGVLDPDSDPVDFYWEMPDYLGLDMDADRQVEISGRQCLVLWKNGEFSPFEYSGAYSVGNTLPEESWRLTTILTDKGSFTGDRVLSIADPGQGLLNIFSFTDDIRNLYNRYPLIYYGFSSIYGPERIKGPEGLNKDIYLQILHPVKSYNLDASVLKGSVKIMINGREETAYTLDSSGNIEFLRYIHPEDRIEITFRTSAVASRGGDLILGIGDKFLLAPGLNLNLGSGLRWNIYSGTYSHETDQNPGSILTSFNIDFQKDNLKAKIDAGFSFSTPDTTGVFRILGMEGKGTIVTVAENNIFPSSTPSGNLETYSILKNNRGKLIYKDYHSYAVTDNGTIKSYDWDIPDDQIYPYETGSKTGPYTALTASGDSVKGRIMVMDYELESGRWSGAQIPLYKNSSPPDLSGSGSLSFYWKAENSITNNVKIWVQAGSIGEDLDNDNILDKESGEYSSGFPFNDTANNSTLLVGGGTRGLGNRIVDSEDFNSNNILDRENPNLIFTSSFDSSDNNFPDNEWKTVSIPITNSDKNKLSSLSAVKIIILNDDSAECTGRLFVSGFSFNGSTFLEQTDDPGIVNCVEIDESSIPVSSLSSSYNEVSSIFHPAGESQQVLEVKWDSVNSNGYIVTAYTQPVPQNLYSKLNMYLRIPEMISSGTPSMNISFTDSHGSGISCAFTPQINLDWQKLTIDLKDASLTIGGQPIEDAVIEISQTSLPLTCFSFSLTGSSEGILYLDEVYMNDADIRISSGAAFDFEYKFPGTLFSINEIPVISNLIIKEQVSVTGSRFAQGFYEAPEYFYTDSFTELHMDLLFINLNTSLNLSWIENEYYPSLGYMIRIPSKSWYLNFTDSYNEKNLPEGNSFSRGNSININIPSIVAFTIKNESATYGETISQLWNTQVSSLWESPVKLSSESALKTASDSFSFNNDIYFKSWFNSYSMILPWTDCDYPERSGKFILDAKIEQEPLGFLFKPELNYKSTGMYSRTQENSGTILVSVPFVPDRTAEKNWKLTAQYKRSFSHTLTAENNKTFFYDFSLFADGIESQTYFYRTIPVFEIFSKNTETYFLSDTVISTVIQASYEPEMSFKYSRSYGSYLIDLFLPSTIRTSVARNLIKEENTFQNTFLWEFKSINTALNLFGSLGAYPFFTFYATDEISSALTVTAESETKLLPDNFEFLLFNYILFIGKNKNTLTLENRFSLLFDKEEEHREFKDQGEITFSWIAVSNSGFLPAFFRLDIENTPYFKHNESMKYTISSDDLNETTVYNFILKHETYYIIQDKGRISAHISFGFDKRAFRHVDLEQDLFMIGLQGGIEAKIQF